MKISLLFGICTILVFSYLLCVAAVAGLQIHCMYSYVDYDYLFMVDRHTIYVLQSMNSIHRLKILIIFFCCSDFTIFYSIPSLEKKTL